jgi:carboxylesterase
MLTTGWADWTAEVEAAYRRLAGRAGKVVVAGLSMGGSLTLWTALEHPEVAGIVCVNPATSPQAAEILTMLDDMLAAGTEVMPGIGSDIADPDSHEIAYEGTPVRPLKDFMDSGLAPLSTRYGELTMPLLLFTSRQDHVVEPSQSEYLAARHGGPVDHRWLERSYHVATQDFDRDLINVGAVEFATSVVGS